MDLNERKIELLERVFGKHWTITWISPHADKDYEVGNSFMIAGNEDKVHRIDKIIRGGARTIAGSNIDCYLNDGDVLTISYAIGPHFVDDARAGRPLEINFCFASNKPYFVFEEYREKSAGRLLTKRSAPKKDGSQIQKRGGHNKGGGTMG